MGLSKLINIDSIVFLDNLIEEQLNNYVTTATSLITLEPDFLIDATAIGECYQQNGNSFQLYFLHKILEDVPGPAALKGTITGYFLDETVRKTEDTFTEIFNKAQRENVLKAAYHGRAEMIAMKSSIERDHSRNIIHLVASENENDLWIEPTFFSVEYGLQGRIDLLSKRDDTNTMDILELKSGKPINSNISGNL